MSGTNIAIIETVWILFLGLAVAIAIATTVGRSQGRGRQADLGFVSHRWIAEHRLSTTQDSQR